MIRIEDILDKAEAYCAPPDLDLLHRAYIFSARAHKDQVRHSGEPYLVHPLEVANLLVDMRLDAKAVATGLLHDVLEDTLADSATLERLFGADVAAMVEGVTKISKISFTSREAEQAENFRKMLLAMVDDIRVIVVKLADRLHNMRTLEHLAPAKRKRIGRETLDIYAPIAHRLGMGRIKSELEDLAFRHLEPEEYASLVAKVEEKRRVSDGFIDAVRARLQERCGEHGIVVEVDGRLKRLYSIWSKIRQQNIRLEEVYDYVAFRVFVDSVKDCYGVLGVVHGTWTPIPGRIKDFIAMPKPNLYQSLHTTVMGDQGHAFEVQIRTHEMHRIAEEGIAAHWTYKEKGGPRPNDAQTFAWLRSLVELGKDVKDPREFLDSLKIDLYPDEVYIFTPQGKVLSFPRGSTGIDFAYAIHTEVGHQCAGVRINGKLRPLRTPLKNGDIVEILRDKAHHPSRDWLKIVATNRARNKIRSWLNAEEAKRAVEVGRSLLERELKRLKVRGHLEDMELEPLLSSLGCNKLPDLYAALGYGKFEARGVALKIAPPAPAPVVPEAGKGGKAAEPAPRRAGGDGPYEGIQVTGHGDMLVALANCCNPIPGDPIVGYVTRGRGVSVHTVDCRNVRHLFYDPARRIDVAWTGAPNAGLYRVGLRIETEDRPGMLATVSSKIAGLNTNIKQVEANTFDDKRGLIIFTLEIADLARLEAICRSINSIDGVLRVTRDVR